MEEKIQENPLAKGLSSKEESSASHLTLEKIANGIGELKELFQKKIQRDQIHREAYEKLYEEMRQYKDNFLLSALRPILLDLILLYDNIMRTEQALPENKEKIKPLKEELLEILYRQDVEPISHSYQKYDRRIHRALKTVSVEDPARDGEIVEIVREGFWYRDQILRPQEVICCKYIKNNANRD